MANPFAAKPNPFAAGGAKPNPFAPSSAAKPNPFAPAGSPAKPNPFAPAGSPAKPNPFASPAKPNPFAPAGATANPFAPAAAAGANPFAPKANPFAQAANPFGATTNAFGGPAGAGVPIAFAEPQDELITRALQQMTRAQTAPGSDDTLAKMESLLKPYIKTFLSTYKFRKLVYNIKDPSASRDPMITPEEWEREMSENRYDEDCNPRVEVMPVALDGFTGLKARMDAQARAIDEFQAHAVKLVGVVKTVETACDRASDRVERIRLRQAQLQQRLLSVAQKVDGVILRGKPETEGETRLYGIIQQLRRYLTSDAHLKERIDQLVLLQRMRADALASGLSMQGRRETVGVLTDDKDVSMLVRQLAVHCKGLEQVMFILRKDIRDLEIVKTRQDKERSERWSKDEGARRQTNMLGLGYT